MWGFAILLFTGCSKDEVNNSPPGDLQSQEESINLLKTNQNLTSNFLPTFTNFYGRDWGTSTYKGASLASEWIHEYDEQGKLVKSFFYELYPYRLLREVNYLGIEDHTLKYEITIHNYYGLIYSETMSYELTLDDHMNITTVDGTDEFIELNDQGWVTLIHAVDANGGVVYKTGYEYDGEGKVLKYMSYDMDGTNYANVDYTYNENGDPLTYQFQNIYGDEIKVNYFYRPDNTLERLEGEYYSDEDDFGTQVFTYTPEERFSTQTTTEGNGAKKVLTYSENEVLVEVFQNDVISTTSLYNILETGYVISVHKEYLNGTLHKVQYFDENGYLDYTEYYDENGELTETKSA